MHRDRRLQNLPLDRFSAALAFALAIALAAACSGGNGGGNDGPIGYAPDSGADADSDAPRDVAANEKDAKDDVGDVATDQPSATCESIVGSPKHITESHGGWKKDDCFDCHSGTIVYPHQDCNLRPPECGSCHGYNGARHSDHASADNPASCTDGCHVGNDHFFAWNQPTDCVKCHYHPDQPEGR